MTHPRKPEAFRKSIRPQHQSARSGRPRSPARRMEAITRSRHSPASIEKGDRRTQMTHREPSEGRRRSTSSGNVLPFAGRSWSGHIAGVR